jgi:hypothetical protein
MGKKAAKNHRSKIQKGAAKVAKSRGGRFSSMVGKGLEKELEAEESVSKGRALIGDLKEGAELASSDDIDDPEMKALEKRAMRTSMTTSRAKDIIKNSDDLKMNDLDNKSDKELQKIANDHKIEKFNNNSRDELRTEFGEKLERKMGNSFKNIKYGEIMDEARKLGVDDQVIQSDVASDYADHEHGIHYNKMYSTMTEADMSDEEKQKAKNDHANASATLDSLDLDTEELANDDVESINDLISLLEQERTFNSDSSATEIGKSMADYMASDGTRSINDEIWEESFDFVDELNTLLDENGMEEIEELSNSDELKTNIPDLISSLDDKSDFGAVGEKFIEEVLFEEDASSKAKANFDVGNIDRNRLTRYVEGETDRSDNAPAIQEAKTAESLRNPDVGGGEESYSTQEAVDNVVQNVRREHSEKVAEKVEEEIMQLDPSDNVTDIELDEIDAFENLGQAITESLNESIKESGYDDFTIDTGQVDNIMSECASHMQTFGEDAIEDLANQTSDMSEELITEAVNESTDLNESQKEEIINKYREEESLDESDIRSLDLDQAENLQRENFAMKFAEKRVAQVDEDLAENLNIEEIMDEYGMNMEVAADRIRRNMEMNDIDTEELAGVVQDLDGEVEERPTMEK